MTEPAYITENPQKPIQKEWTAKKLRNSSICDKLNYLMGTEISSMDGLYLCIVPENRGNIFVPKLFRALGLPSSASENLMVPKDQRVFCKSSGFHNILLTGHAYFFENLSLNRLEMYLDMAIARKHKFKLSKRHLDFYKDI